MIKSNNYLCVVLACLSIILNLEAQDYSFFSEDDLIVDGDPAYLRFYNFGSERSYISHDNPDIVISNLQANGNILFRVDGGVGNDMVIQSGGHVGINKVGPTCALHVVHSNSGNSEGLIIENENNGNFWRMYAASSNNTLRFYNNASPTNVVGSFAVDGNYTASDVRLKENINTFPYNLDYIMQLTPKSYQYNSEKNSKKSSIGFIAQEVKEIIPELVMHDIEEDIYMLNYGGFGVLAIKAIQEQQETIENQENEILGLKARMKLLEQKLETFIKE